MASIGSRYTLVWDCRILADRGYILVKAQPVDMFPHTRSYVDTVALLSKQK